MILLHQYWSTISQIRNHILYWTFSEKEYLLCGHREKTPDKRFELACGFFCSSYVPVESDVEVEGDKFDVCVTGRDVHL